MNKHRRITNLLTAGTIVLLLMLIYLAFTDNTWSDALAAQSAESGMAANSAFGTALTESAANDGATVTVEQQTWTALQEQNVGLHQTNQTLQSQNAELIRAVQLLQEREVQYQTELERANAALQTQAAGSGNGNIGTYQSHEYEHEHEEEYEEGYEHEHEEREHEAYEHDDD